MKTVLLNRLAAAPTPMAGLALGIASLGWCWESAVSLNGYGQLAGALLASPLLLILTLRFLLHPSTLLRDIEHPVLGSVLPTYCMALMVISNCVSQYVPQVGTWLWCLAVLLHLVFLAGFVVHRVRDFSLDHMVPSWFVPPIGIIVADVSFTGGALQPVADALLLQGLLAYSLMLPLMLYRLTCRARIHDAARPTIAILAAPASLCLAGYLTITDQPSMLLVSLLATIALVMTGTVYLAFFKLMKLPFSPSFAAFTFPMVIGATALFKLHDALVLEGIRPVLLNGLAHGELLVATGVVLYVSWHYVKHYTTASQQGALS